MQEYDNYELTEEDFDNAVRLNMSKPYDASKETKNRDENEDSIYPSI